MRVLHLWKSASVRQGGGGAQAMDRLHARLRRTGIDSNLLCSHGADTEASGATLFNPRRRGERLLGAVSRRVGLNDVHRLGSFDLARHPLVSEADVLHLHGTHGFISYLALPRLTREKPAVFTLHDVYPFTGHCSVTYGCERWKDGCGACPHLGAPPAVKRDATWLEWRLKRWAYRRSRMTFVSPASWLTEQVRQSMLADFDLREIPHGVDLGVFRPHDPQVCRDLLGLPRDRLLLMHSAIDQRQHNKGYDLLAEAIKRLPESLRQRLLLVGLGNPAPAGELGVEVANFGYVGDERMSAILYSAADLFVSPSRGEAFGLVALESIACGTPVVAFGVGGLLDLVRPGTTGALAQPESARDLARKLAEMLEQPERLREMRVRCRAVACREYDLDLQTSRYARLYNELISTAATTRTRLHLGRRARPAGLS